MGNTKHAPFFPDALFPCVRLLILTKDEVMTPICFISTAFGATFALTFYYITTFSSKTSLYEKHMAHG